jgi:hypothetical protein
LAVGLVAGANSLTAPFANAATVKLVEATRTTECTYSTISTDANGNMTVTCSGAPAETPTPTPTPTPIGGTPTPTPTPTPSSNPGCPALPANAKIISELGRPQGGGALPSGQEMYNNPSTVVADGTIGSNQILVIPFKTAANGPTRAATLPGNYGGIGGFQVVLSKCPGSLAPTDFAETGNSLCERKGTAPTAYFYTPYCKLEAGLSYYLNVKPINTQESTSSFLFSFN